MITQVGAEYRARLNNLKALALELESKQARAIALTMLGLAAFLILLFEFSWFAIAATPVIGYGTVLYAKYRNERLRTLRLQSYYGRGMARLDDRWTGLGVRGYEFEADGHRYDRDLAVFGEGSLFELLCTCRTEVGRRRLAAILTDPVSLEESRRRQEAVKELSSLGDLRERVQLLGDFSFEQSNWDTIVEWLELPTAKIFSGFRIAAFASSVSLAALLLLAFDRVIGWSAVEQWVGVLLLINGALGMVYRDRIVKSMKAMRSVAIEIGVLRQGLLLLEGLKFKAGLLNELVAGVSGDRAGKKTRHVERLLNAMIERDKEWFYLFSRVLLIGAQVFVAIEQWRATNATAMRSWLVAWGEFEALVALATYAHEHPDNCFPELAGSGPVMQGTAMAHPLLASGECVRNDLLLNSQQKLYVVSGSNMAGKSTLLRTIGLNVVLAYAGAPVCADKLVISKFAVCASLSIQDSLLSRKSKFMAEIDRLRQALEVPPIDGPVLFLIDEILSGTNSRDRRLATEAIILALIERGAVGALSTHDLALTELTAIAELCGTNVHMGSRDDSDPLNFDYVVRPGVTTQSSALAIARLAGVNV